MVTTSAAIKCGSEKTGQQSISPSILDNLKAANSISSAAADPVIEGYGRNLQSNMQIIPTRAIEPIDLP